MSRRGDGGLCSRPARPSLGPVLPQPVERKLPAETSHLRQELLASFVCLELVDVLHQDPLVLEDVALDLQVQAVVPSGAGRNRVSARLPTAATPRSSQAPRTPPATEMGHRGLGRASPGGFVVTALPAARKGHLGTWGPRVGHGAAGGLTCGGRSSWTPCSGGAGASESASSSSRSPSRACERWPYPSSYLEGGNGTR